TRPLAQTEAFHRAASMWPEQPRSLYSTEPQTLTFRTSAPGTCGTWRSPQSSPVQESRSGKPMRVGISIPGSSRVDAIPPVPADYPLEVVGLSSYSESGALIVSQHHALTLLGSGSASEIGEL